MTQTRLRKRPRQQRSNEMLARIVAAAGLLLEEAGLEAFNTNAVARRAGVSVGSLYQYFGTKDAVLCAVWREREAQLAAALRACPRQEFAPWLDASIAAYIDTAALRSQRLLYLHGQMLGWDLGPSPAVAAWAEALRAWQNDIPAGIGQNAAEELHAIIAALVVGERQSMAGWRYTLTQRIRRTVKGYLALGL